MTTWENERPRNEPTRKARYAVRILSGDRFVEQFWHRSLEWATARAKYGVSDQIARDIFDRKRMTSVAVFTARERALESE